VPQALPTDLIVSCTSRDRRDPDRSIDELGGQAGVNWRLALADALALHDRGTQFFIKGPGGRLVPLQVLAVGSHARHFQAMPNEGARLVGSAGVRSETRPQKLNGTQGTASTKQHHGGHMPMGGRAPRSPPYLLGCARASRVRAREGRRCRHGFSPPAAGMAWGVLPPAPLVRRPLMGTCGLIADS